LLVRYYAMANCCADKVIEVDPRFLVNLVLQNSIIRTHKNTNMTHKCINVYNVMQRN